MATNRTTQDNAETAAVVCDKVLQEWDTLMLDPRLVQWMLHQASIVRRLRHADDMRALRTDIWLCWTGAISADTSAHRGVNAPVLTHAPTALRYVRRAHTGSLYHHTLRPEYRAVFRTLWAHLLPDFTLPDPCVALEGRMPLQDAVDQLARSVETLEPDHALVLRPEGKVEITFRSWPDPGSRVMDLPDIQRVLDTFALHAVGTIDTVLTNWSCDRGRAYYSSAAGGPKRS
ncbi:hypothetical protein EBT31_06500 [bacterium]|nr:hypothetical protein [bacterium]